MMKGLEGVGKNSDEKIVFDKMDTNCGDITIVVEDDAGDDGVENMEEDVQDDDPDLGAKMEDEGIVEIVIPLKAS